MVMQDEIDHLFHLQRRQVLRHVTAEGSVIGVEVPFLDVAEGEAMQGGGALASGHRFTYVDWLNWH